MNTGLWLDLLNSDWRDHRGSGRREDRLDDPRWLKAYLSRWGLELAAPAGEKAVRSLRGLRDVIRRIVDKCSARRRVTGDDWDRLSSYMGRVPIVRRVTVSGGKPAMVQVSQGNRLEAALAAIAASFAETVVYDDPSRIKVCQNKDCLWVFFDRSKNRSRRWCENTCGNLMKVRRFRRRRQALS